MTPVRLEPAAPLPQVKHSTTALPWTNVLMIFPDLRGKSRISGKGVQMYRGWGFTLLNLSHFSQISHENEIIWSRRDQIISFLWDI